MESKAKPQIQNFFERPPNILLYFHMVLPRKTGKRNILNNNAFKTLKPICRKQYLQPDEQNISFFSERLSSSTVSKYIILSMTDVEKK